MRRTSNQLAFLPKYLDRLPGPNLLGNVLAPCMCGQELWPSLIALLAAARTRKANAGRQPTEASPQNLPPASNFKPGSHLDWDVRPIAEREDACFPLVLHVDVAGRLNADGVTFTWSWSVGIVMASRWRVC